MLTILVVCAHVLSQLLETVLDALEKVFFSLVFVLAFVVNAVEVLQINSVLFLQTLLLLFLFHLSELLVFLLHGFVLFTLLPLDPSVQQFLFGNLPLNLF